MVTTIGIDPHKATHTAVAIDEAETVLGELTVPADRYQIARLLDWAVKVDGDGDRVWAVESAGGLGYLLSQQLIADGEHVVDVPAVLASRVRVCLRGSRIRTIRMMPARWRSRRYANPGWRWCGDKTTPQCCGCWRNGISNSPACAPRRCAGSTQC